MRLGIRRKQADQLAELRLGFTEFTLCRQRHGQAGPRFRVIRFVPHRFRKVSRGVCKPPLAGQDFAHVEMREVVIGLEANRFGVLH